MLFFMLFFRIWATVIRVRDNVPLLVSPIRPMQA